MKNAVLSLFIGSALVLFFPCVSVAKIGGDCSGCHTDNNGPQEIQSGALDGADCTSCHAMGVDERIVTLPDGTQVPQVFHRDPMGDLAGGNFLHVVEPVGIGPLGSKKGHDVIELFPNPFTHPPGFIHERDLNYFNKITCAGVNGCHGLRNQMMATPEGVPIPRVGVAALRGAHHANVDGALAAGDTVANSYRFLMGVHGLENPYSSDRWQNVSPLIHNEYFGSTYMDGDYRECSTCHTGSTNATFDSYISAPRNSMTGFCSTCHSNFHMQAVGITTFLRHPSDYVIPNRGEYAEYRFYEITAPVARPYVYPEPSEFVNPGQDMVMCLSCHVAHASPYDGALRFDFTTMTAGDAGSAAGIGCFACHTSKGGR